ncbi:hypothetical protein FACS189441_6220 [Betaproteobacteria bacterium]|nr:hypothetical protein FACS189441_6220 [Betaproteobacteria bacterium]
METVELTFQYSRQEHIKATRQYLFADKRLRKYDVVVVPSVLACSVFLMFYASFAPMSVAFFALGFVWAMMTGMMYFYVPAKNFQQYEKLHDGCRLSFSENSIHFNTAKISSELQWSVYSEVWENGEFYFLIQLPQMYALLPKRVFTPEQETAFKEILASVFPRIRRI